jgi:PGM1 C-terminal domain/ATP-grasp domain
VVVPSISFPVVELVKIAAVQSYEERMLFLLLLLADAETRVVFVSSVAIDPAIVDYYLRFLPDPVEARTRLAMVDAGDPAIGSLSAKLLRDPVAMNRLREAVGSTPGTPTTGAYMLPFNVTPAESDLAAALGVPLLGPRPDLVRLGSKSGSRQVAARAGVRYLTGAEDLFSLKAVAAAIADVQAVRPEAEAVVVKLNNGFAGQGNALIELGGLAEPLPASSTVFCAPEESWESFEAKIEAEGAIVEELLRGDGLRSPSVQLQISADGTIDLLSTHDQILGGPSNQVYIGCRFPARADYRLTIQREALKVAEVLAAEGVVGAFGIDFLVTDHGEVSLSEINLRMGGTTHPFWMARLATGADYDPSTGEMRVEDGGARCYLSTDNLKSARLVGRTPAEVVATVDRSGLAFDPATGIGVTLHLLGALPGAGKMGVTCIAETTEQADQMYQDVLVALDAR